MRPTDLRGEALSVFEMWRNLGLSESAAMDEVRRAGYGPGTERPTGFDELAGLFESIGLSPNAARVAAVGRADGETEARESFAQASRLPSGVPYAGNLRFAFSDAVTAVERFHRKSREDAHQWVQRKYDAEWSHLSAREAARQLTSYARLLESGTRRQSPAPVHEARPASTSPRRVEINETGDHGWQGWQR